MTMMLKLILMTVLMLQRKSLPLTKTRTMLKLFERLPGRCRCLLKRRHQEGAATMQEEGPER